MTTKTCECSEATCKENCITNHTHKEFWCEKCKSERYMTTHYKTDEEIRKEFNELAKKGYFTNKLANDCNYSRTLIYILSLRSSDLAATLGTIEGWVEKNKVKGVFVDDSVPLEERYKNVEGFVRQKDLTAFLATLKK